MCKNQGPTLTKLGSAAVPCLIFWKNRHETLGIKMDVAGRGGMLPERVGYFIPSAQFLGNLVEGCI